jgi:alkylhydroperoxidase family enzyme
MAFWRWLTGRESAQVAAPVAGGRVLPAYAALARYRLGAAGLEPRIRLLVSQLAAERSACVWCVEHGRHLWREALLPGEVLRALPDYESSPAFTPRERAALAFADALTRFSDAAGGMPEEPITAVRKHFSEPEIVALTETVAARHFFNPITGALGADAEPAAPRPAWHPHSQPRSAVRNLWR